MKEDILEVISFLKTMQTTNFKSQQPKNEKRRACKECKKKFIPAHESIKHCSNECYGATMARQAHAERQKQHDRAIKAKKALFDKKPEVTLNHPNRPSKPPIRSKSPLKLDPVDSLFKSLGHKPRKGKVFKCICGKSFYRKPSFVNYRNLKNRFCSRKCASLSFIRGEDLICKNCKKKYHTHPGQIKWRGSNYCSKKCQYKKQRGKNLHNWKGGRSFKKYLWIIFSKYIRLRDKGVCISCGMMDEVKNMDAGHYKPRTAGLSLFFDERNVNCQCKKCNRTLNGNLTKYAFALKIKYGEEILNELEEKVNEKIKISIPEYRRKVAFYKDKINELL